MSFLTGKTEQTPTSQTPQDAMGLRSGLINFLMNQGFDTAITGLPKGGDFSPFMKLFQTQLAPVLAQAKESAGNLTGSSLGNVLGATAGRSTSDFILNLLNQRATRFSSLLNPLVNQQQGVQTTYKPGFLDYLFKGVGAAAPLLAGPAGIAASAGAKAVNYGYGGDTSSFGAGFGPSTPGEGW